MHCNDATCSSSTSTTLDSTGNVGRYPSVTVGSDGFGLVSYLDSTNGNLKAAHCTNLACTSFTNGTIVSSGTVADDSTSVNVGTDGFGIVSYVDGGNLRVAHCTNVACSSAGANTIEGFYTSLTIGSDGLGLVSYRDATSSALKVAHCDNLACSSATLSTIDSNGIEGEYSSITVGTDGLGVISYYDGTGAAQDLKVAHCGSVTCSTSSVVAVDTAGQVGWNTSITVGSDGLPFVSYRDVTGDSVKGLHCPNVFCVGHLRRR